ncbi:MAG: hypothetical protein Q8T09_11245 [Candidatus Melainabacteria bacterium]|nr:hypothetical protein [Candidatus Melainabacteria bacterium]
MKFSNAKISVTKAASTHLDEGLPVQFVAINYAILIASYVWGLTALLSFFIDSRAGFAYLAIGLFHAITYLLASDTNGQ